MDGFEKIRQIWLSEETAPLYDLKKIEEAIKEYQSSRKKNIYILIAMAFLCLISVSLIVFFVKIDHYTRILGGISFLAGLVMVLILKIKSLNNVNAAELFSNQEFLNELQKKTSKRTRMNYFQITTFILIGIGYALFIYEDISGNVLMMVFSYVLLVVFLLFMYFIFRPFTQKVSKKKITKLLEKIEDIKSQIK